jgi:abnormal spindle-like microcephaly-associated protein
MLRRLSATPCPVNEPWRSENRRDSIVSTSEDTTTNLDYTTEFKALFRNTKPRRRPTTVAKSHGAPLGFTIHEDEELKLDGPIANVNATHLPSRASIISQPAQRPKRRVSFVQPQHVDQNKEPPATLSPKMYTAPRRISIGPGRQTMEFPAHQDETLPRIPSPKISKPARRGTIYIPNDDTTMPSAYMGIFSPIKTMAGKKEEDVTEVTGLAAQMAKKKAPRKSMIVGSPKRPALLPNAKPLQMTATHEDRIGVGTGKENLPPGYQRLHTSLNSKKARKSELPFRSASEQPVASAPSSRIFTETASSMARSKDKTEAPNAINKPAWNSGAVTKARPRHSIAVTERPPQNPAHQESLTTMVRAPQVPTRFVVPQVSHQPVLSNLPLLDEGVADASVYEEGWLGQQEVAITQLVNNLFRASTPAYSERMDHDLLRMKLLELYGSPDLVLLHKRVHGALLYGALGISKDNSESGQRVKTDIGHRKTFINLWLKTYEHDLLLTALEVVVGRSLRASNSRSSDARSPPSSPPSMRSTLQRAIETLLIRNEDGVAATDSDSSVWSVQRTLLRSLMLIKVLDELKTQKHLPPVGNLFQNSSVHKTSTSVVRQLVRLMNPSVGDAIRALNHLGYSLNHSQYPLEEFEYEITNMAVDLRDGVRFTRLVELLLYRSASSVLDHRADADATTTIVMPTGETLSLTDGEQDWPLSQHLKLPCLGHATKAFNNQIALSALQGVNGYASLLQEITADDLVNGYREKTVRLLWSLTSKWGLGGLVDWADVTREIKRLGRQQGKVGDWASSELDLDDEDPLHLRCKSLLKLWVKAVAGAHGVSVRNFTTSFADGRVFQAIIDEYLPHLSGMASLDKESDLASKLRSIGCSAEFTKLFERRPGGVQEHIFDRDFVLASSAFLCSRLLGPSRQARAATTLQRAWRRHWDKVLMKRRRILHQLAAACAAKVQEISNESHAKATIWRAWKAYKERKYAEHVVGSGSNAVVVQEDVSDIWLSLR